ncbi:hypothetical protein LF41_1233 [Lysobacter dokdonensis DS-58]|uniref:Uncharacterized protein n=1 Tax=Lysobacter dokdonensis DS-58 TaxID=1300345 RepID=A0A0A2X666_9GAMM|nr:hypothetical protein [Lysobacter dokdonensis]KGQ20694.1 hypothetical protein LF41_1233 [Lysobacter dokdonensis DS-58]
MKPFEINHASRFHAGDHAVMHVERAMYARENDQRQHEQLLALVESLVNALIVACDNLPRPADRR